MEPWARRIKESLEAQGLSQAELARACKLGAGSVSGWFGQGKPTKMISGDNLVAASAFLGLTAEYIMTGRPGPAAPSHSMGLDLDKLSTVLAVVEGAIADSRKKVPAQFKASMIKRVYESQQGLSADTADAVRAALASLLETMGTE